ncbi:hypothetical protein DPEC_G00297310 [Dallia pectoralis]|uniref:Uncharacterized protein n=1 Tax=Dallia pectoralis TaxID=75939 RepID=A0ACC2FFQ9_DALPE|nr:hypothetical protein DPEC_G00297310 [Dallia pectoralis]
MQADVRLREFVSGSKPSRLSPDLEFQDGFGGRTGLSPCQGWSSVAAICVMWCVSQKEAPLYPSLTPHQVWFRLLLASLLSLGMGVCLLTLRSCRLKHTRGALHPKFVDVVHEVPRGCTGQCPSSAIETGTAVWPGPVVRVLTDSLLLCVLKETQVDPTPRHIQSLIDRLQTLSEVLQRTDVQLEVESCWEGVDSQWRRRHPPIQQTDYDPSLTPRVKHIINYLQKRIERLCVLQEVQNQFKERIRETRGGLEWLWCLLEELHIRVTITKPLGNNYHREVYTVHRHIQCVCTNLAVYRSRLERCQTLLIDSAVIIQALSRAHLAFRRSVNASHSVDSVWTELLLQSNMEQFDDIQGMFLSLEQQTTNFQIHLEGLTPTEGAEPV